jgi:hypothetical protein
MFALTTLAIGTPPSSHFIYIPVIFALGITLGFIFGSKATRDAIAFEQKKEQEREARRAAREATKRAAQGQSNQNNEDNKAGS